MLAKNLARYLISVGVITLLLRILAESSTNSPEVYSLQVNYLGNGSVLVGIIFYFYGILENSLKVEDSFETNFKRLIYKIDRFICKNLILSIILVIMFFLSVYKLVIGS